MSPEEEAFHVNVFEMLAKTEAKSQSLRGIAIIVVNEDYSATTHITYKDGARLPLLAGITLVSHELVGMINEDVRGKKVI